MNHSISTPLMGLTSISSILRCAEETEHHTVSRASDALFLTKMALSLDQALLFLQSDAEVPSLDMLVFTLRKCRKEKNLRCARKVQTIAYESGFDSHAMLGNFTVPMFVECGSIEDAQQVFYRVLPHPNEHSWSSLIQGYSEYGDPHHAFSLFQEMQNALIVPSLYTYVALLKACGRTRSRNGREKCLQIHLDVSKRGFDEEPFVGNQLVDMYAKCSLLLEAKNLFDWVGSHDVVSWTSLLTRYVEHGRNEEALRFFQEMKVRDVLPNDVTFVCLVKSCSNLGAINEGRNFHAEIIKEGFEGNNYIGNILLDFYVKCGSLVEAQEVFDDLLDRDTVSWTSLIAGYAELGFGDEALNCLDKMDLEGIQPNLVTYAYGVKACCNVGAIDRGKILHAAIVKRGLEEDELVSSSLVDFYSRCGMLNEAQAVFDDLHVRNVVLWTTLIGGYAEYGLGKEALSCFTLMQREDVDADEVMFVCILKVCGQLRLIERGLSIHAEIVRDGFDKDSYVESSLIDMYAKCGFLVEAQDLLNELQVQSLISWTALMGGYVEYGYGKEALACISEMRLQGLFPNSITFMYALKACMIVPSIKDGQEFHMDLVKIGFEKDPFISSALVEIYAKCGYLMEFQKVFIEVPRRDIVLWNALIVGYIECKLHEEALRSLKQMQIEGIEADVASWNTLFLGFAEHGEYDKVHEIYTRMLDQALLPDSTSFVGVLKACGNKATLRLGRIIHAQIDCINDLDSGGLIIGAALVDMYCKCGSMEDALLVFREMPKKDIVVWSTLLAGYARHGESEHVLGLFEEMRMEKIKPDEYTFLSVLTACSHAGHMNKGLTYFEMMSKEYGIIPNVVHQNCIIDMFSRAGKLGEAMVLMRSMPFQPDLVTWKTVLQGCHRSASLELGQWVFEHVSHLSENDGAAFTLMSNIYADANMHHDVTEKKEQHDLVLHDAGHDQYLAILSGLINQDA